MKAITFAAVLGMVMASGLSHASISIFSGPGNISGDENVLFNDNGLVTTGTTINGELNQSGTIVDFFGAGKSISGNGGQATIQAPSGGSLSALQIALHDRQSTFTSLVYNLNAKESGNVTFNISDASTGSVLSQTFSLDKNGENYFRIVADGSSKISLAGFSSTAELGDVKQVRIGGVAPVPEPASILTIGGGVLAFMRRRRKNA